MTQEELNTLTTQRVEANALDGTEKEVAYEFYQAGFKKALEMVSEAMNEGKDLIDEFDEVM